MVVVEFLGPISAKPLELNIQNLSQLASILQKDDTLNKWLKNSAVAVNDVLTTSIDYDLKDGDKVSLLPPVCGG